MRKNSPQSAGCHPRAWLCAGWLGVQSLLTWHDKRVTVEMHEPQKNRESTFFVKA